MSIAYVALGARRSVREAARQYHSKTIAAGEISSVEDTTVRTWLGWSARHKWVSRSLARDEWIARTSDEQIIINKLACDLCPAVEGRRGMMARAKSATAPSDLPVTVVALADPAPGVCCSRDGTAAVQSGPPKFPMLPIGDVARVLEDMAAFEAEGLVVFEAHPDGRRWRVLPPDTDPA